MRTRAAPPRTPPPLSFAAMAADTRQRLIDAAVGRFYRDGFRNVGLDQILADVGISKTAFYKHFESKDDLMLAVLEYKNRWLQDLLRETCAARGDRAPGDELRALFDVVEQFVEADDFHGCIFVNVVMEFPLPHEPAHQAAAQHKRAIEALVCELAQQAGAADPQTLAKDLCLVMEGAYVTRQVTGDAHAGVVARRVAECVISSHLSLLKPTKLP
ncbi:MAG TPA: TetR/AcrR family transcriptional regulator [Lacipirellulaceae bacterium]|nr:TetR/AcrR family transcriptional regulator [Lacipirellulaceae bacterium]